MNNLLKFYNGLPIFTSPWQANSYFYSPGLEYLTYPLIKTFGVVLDIRYFRLIVIIIGFITAIFTTMTMNILVSKIENNAQSIWLTFIIFGLALLSIFQNFTADVVHPDCLHILHAVIVLYLCCKAVFRKSFKLALISVIVAGIGVFTKQTEVLAVVGPLLIYTLMNIWGWKRLLLLIVVGSCITIISIFLLWLPEYAYFYTYEIPANNALMLKNLLFLANLKFWGVLPVFVLAACIYLWFSKGEKRSFFICWLLVGLFAAVPNILAYIKYLGNWNNLGIIKLWLLIICWPCLLFFPRIFLQFFWLNKDIDAKKIFLVNSVTIILFLGLLIQIYPKKVIPTNLHYKYCQAIEDLVKHDVQNKRSVMISQGTMYYISAGFNGVPLDRGNSVLELKNANKLSLAGTKERIATKSYDRIYLNTNLDRYGKEILETIDKNYILIESIAPPPESHDFFSGLHPGLLGLGRVFAPSL
ncbi:MAG: hypothetical protein ABH859_06190 [Pseudomonadota bacterium]